MKNRGYYSTKKIFYVLITIMFIFVLMIGVNLFSLSGSEIPLTFSKYRSQTAALMNTGVTERCEIIVDQPTEEYLQVLNVTYPHCKIIQKQNLYQFDLINYLLNFFN